MFLNSGVLGSLGQSWLQESLGVRGAQLVVEERRRTDAHSDLVVIITV